MKKNITVLFLLLLAVCGTAIISSCGSAPKAPEAITSPESDFEVTTADDQVTITEYMGNAVAVGIPATIGGLPVTSIGDRAFFNCTGLTAINIPASVTSIGSAAFYNCTGLTAINIPTSVTSIGIQAFDRCQSLTSISIPAGVTSIGNWAFDGCIGLASIQVNTNNNEYSSRDGVLFNKTGDTLIAYPKERIGQYAIPASVTSIGVGAFADCYSLTSVSIPAGVTSIGERAFASCYALTSVSIPAGVTTIGNSAFSYCYGLTSVSIPASVTSIGGTTFGNCTGLTSIQMDTNNNHYSSRNGVLFSKTGDTLITYPAGLIGQYAIPSGVTSIGNSAFSRCMGLTSVSIPASVTSIGRWAFYGCTGLTAINIPAGVTSIEDRAFYGCTGLTSINIPAGVTSIEGEVFVGCTDLTSIRIGANVNISNLTPFDNDFRAYYNTNSKKAGVYTFRNNGWSYAAQ